MSSKLKFEVVLEQDLLTAEPVVDVRVCRICFATDCKLYPIMTYKVLSNTYETLTGLLIENKDNLPPYLCSKCTCQLLDYAHFRTTTLQAHLLLQKVIKKQGCITLELIKSVRLPSKLTLNKTDCSDQIGHDLDLKLTKLENIHTDEQNVIVDCTIKSEIDDVMVRDDVINEDITYNDMSYISSLSEDVTHHEVKTDQCGRDQDGHNEDTGGGIIDSGDVFIGSLADLSQKPVLSTRSVQRKMKAPKTPSPVKVVSHQNPEAEGILLIPKTLRCDKCPFQTIYEVHLSNHQKAHTATKAYSCNICNYITVNKQSLTLHGKVHSSEKPYSCDLCYKAFNNKATYTMHLRVHSGEKPYACKICNKIFNDKSNRTRHMRTHSGKKPYSCDICQKSFNQKGSLTTHSRTHSGEKPFSCNICNKLFNDKYILQRHLRAHSGTKPYSCDVCRRSFNRKTNLASHLRTHSSEKPYPCGVCNRAFSRKPDLKKHLRIHSGV